MSVSRRLTIRCEEATCYECYGCSSGCEDEMSWLQDACVELANTHQEFYPDEEMYSVFSSAADKSVVCEQYKAYCEQYEAYCQAVLPKLLRILDAFLGWLKLCCIVTSENDETSSAVICVANLSWPNCKFPDMYRKRFVLTGVLTGVAFGDHDSEDTREELWRSVASKPGCCTRHIFETTRDVWSKTCQSSVVLVSCYLRILERRIQRMAVCV